MRSSPRYLLELPRVLVLWGEEQAYKPIIVFAMIMLLFCFCVRLQFNPFSRIRVSIVVLSLPIHDDALLFAICPGVIY